jgi:phenylacetyl-CoA:acceptor oxidoreductase subunit 1
MTRWAMLADLDRCVGCQTCVAACRHANATPPAVQWRKVLDIESGSYPDVRRTFVPVGCQHCDDPPCMHVCPSTATRKRADGIVTIDYDLCIGCAYCDVACPYQARFKIDAPRFAYGAAMANEIERESPDMVGVAQKCTFCVSRIDDGLARNLTPGLDPEATPACVNSCIAGALHFGDIDNPESNVSRLLRAQSHIRMHEEVGTGPRFYYLYDKAAQVDGGTDRKADLPTAAGQMRAKGIEPAHQQHWDWKAAGNFMCGGAGSGLFIFAALAELRGLPATWPGSIALALVATGLFLVLLKIGRPWRALNVLRQPRRSWMAREAWIAAVFFPVSVLGLWFASLPLIVVGAIAAFLFLYAQAMILKEAKGIPAWREPLIVPLIVTTGLAEGGGLILAVLPFLSPLLPLAKSAAIAVVLVAAVRGLAWRTYLAALVSRGAPVCALDRLSQVRVEFLVAGLILPVTGIAVGFAADHAQALLFALSGLLVFGTGWRLKHRLITRAGYNQGFALVQVPARGAEQPAGAVKPGWQRPSGDDQARWTWSGLSAWRLRHEPTADT